MGYSLCHLISCVLGLLAILFKSKPENKEKFKDTNETEPMVSHIDVKEKLDNYTSQLDERKEVLKIAQKSCDAGIQDAYSRFTQSSIDYYQIIKIDIIEKQ